MTFPLLGLRALSSLTRNKKAREALAKSVGQFRARREDLAKARPAKSNAIDKAVDVGTAGVAGFGAGVAATMEYNRNKKAKKVAKQPKTAKPKMKPAKFK